MYINPVLMFLLCDLIEKFEYFEIDPAATEDFSVDEVNNNNDMDDIDLGNGEGGGDGMDMEM